MWWVFGSFGVCLCVRLCEGANPKCTNAGWLKLSFKMCGGKIFKPFGSVSVSPKSVRKFMLRCQSSIYSSLFFGVRSFFWLAYNVSSSKNSFLDVIVIKDSRLKAYYGAQLKKYRERLNLFTDKIASLKCLK